MSAERGPRLLVGAGSCGLAVGAGAVLAALHDEVARRGAALPVVAAGCTGMCWQAVQVTLQRPGAPDRTFASVEPAAAEALVALALGQEAPAAPAPSVIWDAAGIAAEPCLAGQTRRLLERAGRVDPIDLPEALARGRYSGLARALSLAPEAALAEIDAAEIGGRGGAYFPIGRKLAAARRTPGRERVLVVNAEEGEPGAVKDRHLLEADPHLVVEGALIAARAMEATRAVVFLNGQARLSGERLQAALAQAERAGLTRILPGEAPLPVELRRGGGGYVLGEETALLEAIEGRRPMPRPRPPVPPEAGLRGLPTAICNVETLANLPLVLNHGAAWFREVGTERGWGTKLICLSGALQRPGVVEVPIGTPLADVLGLAGGALPGHALQAVLSGGPSGVLVPPALFATPLEPRVSQVLLGSGNLCAIDERLRIVDLVAALTRFNAEESCGKCTPCREGVARLALLLERLAIGESPPNARADLELLCEVAARASLCGLGQMAPNPITSALEHFGLPGLEVCDVTHANG